ncbi:hypothetical protein HHK36_000823 [Tetracentron sinense]|uniref:Tubulin-specific chaperone A n=1 Tax=Tetracentron sinense TaxID=13715 RepID=A0A835A1P5_TETSI|nr:hypothetical protein HHK36_000823 [Tetracentron sinense]
MTIAFIWAPRSLKDMADLLAKGGAGRDDLVSGANLLISLISFVFSPSWDVINMATLRNLKIKTGTCKRIIKELHSYEKEVEREAAKTADMKEKGADPYDLKQQENVLAESRMMIPDCNKRLEASLADLKGTLVLYL